MIKNFFYILTVLLVCSCNNNTYTTVIAQDKFSIDVPSFFKNNLSNNLNAPIQLESPENDFYLIVIDENKENLKKYNLPTDKISYTQKIIKHQLLLKLNNAQVDSLNSLNALRINGTINDITGFYQDKKIFYKIAVVETNQNLYQILMWTKFENRSTFEKDMVNIIQSFKEIKKSNT